MIRGRRTGVTCIRRCLCFVNAFAWLIGCSILGGGVWLKVSYAGYGEIIPSTLPLYVLCLALGSIVFTVALCGCCGSWFSSRCILIIYFGLVTLALVLEVTVASLFFTFREGVTDGIQSQLSAGLQTLNISDDENTAMHSWNNLQSSFKCCGVSSPLDWQKDLKGGRDPKGGNSLPSSCCPAYSLRDCRIDRHSAFFSHGCYQRVTKWLLRKLHIIGAVALSFVFVQMLALIASLLLICTMKEKMRTPTYKSYAIDTLND